MSQEYRESQGGERDISRIANEHGEQKNYDGFEGMNYEQIRQPYNPRHINRTNSKDERKDGKRPDEG